MEHPVGEGLEVVVLDGGPADVVVIVVPVLVAVLVAVLVGETVGLLVMKGEIEGSVEKRMNTNSLKENIAIYLGMTEFII